jgi:hypothetical protein
MFSFFAFRGTSQPVDTIRPMSDTGFDAVNAVPGAGRRSAGSDGYLPSPDPSGESPGSSGSGNGMCSYG